MTETAKEKTLGEWLKQPEYMQALVEILIEEHGLEAVLAAAGMEFAGCYDEPTKGHRLLRGRVALRRRQAALQASGEKLTMQKGTENG